MEEKNIKKEEVIEGGEEKEEEEKSDMYMPQTTPEKIAYSEQLKKEGIDLFRKGENIKAMKKFKMIFLYLRGLEGNLSSVMSSQNQGPQVQAANKPKETETEKKLRILMVAANLNISLCYVKMGKGRQARRYAGRVLESDKENVKATFRRGQGWMIDGFVDNAKNDFMKVLKKYPNDTGVKKALIQLKQKRKEVLKKEKKIFKNMKFE